MLAGSKPGAATPKSGERMRHAECNTKGPSFPPASSAPPFSPARLSAAQFTVCKGLKHRRGHVGECGAAVEHGAVPLIEEGLQGGRGGGSTAGGGGSRGCLDEKSECSQVWRPCLCAA